MKDTKRMLRPYELWNPGVVEQWLEEEAAKGWRLTDWSGWRVKFEAAEPKPCRVRVYPQSEPESREAFWERIAAYEEMGWHFAAAIGLDFEVFYCDDPEIPELFTDPETYALAWKKQLDGAQAIAKIALAAAVILEIMLTALFCVKAGSFLQGMLDMTVFFWLLILLVLPVISALAVRQLVVVQKLRRQIAAGVKPAADPNWRKRRRWWKAVVVLYALYWTIFTFRDIAEHRLFEPDTDGLPYITTSELAPETNVEDWEFDFEGYACYGSLLRPVRYETRFEHGERVVRNEGHRLRFECLAKALYQEKLKQFRAGCPEAEETAVENAAFDAAVLLTDGDAQILLVRAEKIVYSLWVSFPVDMEAVAEAVVSELEPR